MKVCQNQDSLTIDFFLGTDYTENTDFLYSFSVKSVESVPKRNRQVYFDTLLLKIKAFQAFT